MSASSQLIVQAAALNSAEATAALRLAHVDSNLSSVLAACVSQWYQGPATNRIYFIKDDRQEVIAYALLSKMDFDPVGEHENPRMIELVYTVPSRRREGLANVLLTHIIGQSGGFSTCPSNSASEKLLTKVGFVKHPQEPVWRHSGVE